MDVGIADQPVSTGSAADRGSAAAVGATGTVAALGVLTSVLLVAAEGKLSGSVPMTVAALHICGVILLLVSPAVLLWRRTGSIEACALLIAACLAVVLWLRNEWLVFALIPAALVVVRSMDLRRVVDTILSTKVLVGAAIAATLILTVTHYADFLIMDKLRVGAVPQDALYHASIAAMTKTYGVASTGLDGVLPARYHVLSHQMFAALSILSGVHILETYGVAHIVVLCPLLIAAITWCACRVSGCDDANAAIRYWVLVCAVLILWKILPLEKLAVWDDYFVGESYTLSIALLMLAIPALADTRATTSQIAAAAVLVFLAGLSKGSTGITGCALLWARAIFLPSRGNRRLVLLISLLFTIAFLYAMFGAASQAAEKSPFNPFYYAQVHSKVYVGELRETVRSVMSGTLPAAGVAAKAAAGLAVYLLANFFLSAVVVVRRILESGTKRLLGFPDSLFSVVAVAVGLATAMFQIIGGSDFINLTIFVALPFIIVNLEPHAPRRPMPAALTACTVCLGAVFLCVITYRDHGGIFVKSRHNLDQHRYKSNIDALLALRDQHNAQPVVFVRDAAFPGRGVLWSCAQAPFVYPAVTERAWVGVIDVDSECPYDNYLYPPYFTGTPRRLVPAVIPPKASLVHVSGAPDGTLNGEWTSAAFSTAAFSASGSMTWKVEPSDVITYAYTVIGKTMTVAFDIDGTDVGGTPGVALQLAVPGGFVAARTMFGTLRVRDNGTDTMSIAQVPAGGNIIYLYRTPSGDTWTAPGRDARVAGSITFEIR